MILIRQLNKTHRIEYSLLEYLLSDFKNIKESLHQITKYIKNKKIDSSKANKIPHPRDIGKTI